MKKVICLLLAMIFFLCGCTRQVPPNGESSATESGETSTKVSGAFSVKENGNIVSADGVEYIHLANEGVLYYFGDTEYAGSVKGDERFSQNIWIPYRTGMFTLKQDETNDILIRRLPDNEWHIIYRKASLPAMDISVDNCIRLELVSENYKMDVIHTTCGEGITDKAEIVAFLSDVRSQSDPRTAGLYDMIKKPAGMLENCYVYGVIYGFFEAEPNLAVRMEITSFNDLAYSVSIEGKEYVLPTQWLQKLENK